MSGSGAWEATGARTCVTRDTSAATSKKDVTISQVWSYRRGLNDQTAMLSGFDSSQPNLTLEHALVGSRFEIMSPSDFRSVNRRYMMTMVMIAFIYCDLMSSATCCPMDSFERLGEVLGI